MLACKYGHLSVVQELLNTARCNKEAKDYHGMTGFDWAIDGGIYYRVAELMRQHGGNRVMSPYEEEWVRVTQNSHLSNC